METLKDLKEHSGTAFRIVGEGDVPKEEHTMDIPPEL